MAGFKATLRKNTHKIALGCCLPMFFFCVQFLILIFLIVCLCVSVCMNVGTLWGQRHQIPWSWSYSWLWATHCGCWNLSSSRKTKSLYLVSLFTFFSKYPVRRTLCPPTREGCWIGWAWGRHCEGISRASESMKVWAKATERCRLFLSVWEDTLAGETSKKVG